MKKLLLSIVLLLALYSCNSRENLQDVLNTEYEEHFISSGNNFPQISLYENDRYKFLVGLHNEFEPQDVQLALNWTDETFTKEVAILKENGYLTGVGNNLSPSISIVMQNEGELMFEQSEKVANAIARSIEQDLDRYKHFHKNLELSAKAPYEQFSFFLFSNVLLDNWQINHVEQEFLKKERTLRHGNRYYIQYAEKNPLNEKEVFGIYGNQYNCNDSVCIITYGNNRNNHQLGFEELLALDIPTITTNDQVMLDSIAEAFKPELLTILEQNKPEFIKHYNESRYVNELSFEEYFIWYYHFLYTRVTDILNDKGLIQIPEDGIYRVKIEQ
jgi:hypothetical protein